MCAVVVLSFLSKSNTYSGKTVAPTFSASHTLSQPKEEQSLLHENRTSQATVAGDAVTSTFSLSHTLHVTGKRSTVDIAET